MNRPPEAERAWRRENKRRLRRDRPWRCAARMPATLRRCVLGAGHAGEHEAIVAAHEDGPEFSRWTDTVVGSGDAGGGHGMA